MFDPISFAIDKVEELMGHSPHPAIVTVPPRGVHRQQRLRRPGLGDRRQVV